MSNEQEVEKKDIAQGNRNENIIILEEIVLKHPSKKPPNFFPNFYKIIIHTPKNPMKIKLSEV